MYTHSNTKTENGNCCNVIQSLAVGYAVYSIQGHDNQSCSESGPHVPSNENELVIKFKVMYESYVI